MTGNNLEHILRLAEQQISCPICKRSFKANELRIRGRFKEQYLVQTSCHKGHNPALVLYIVSSQLPGSIKPITADQVLDLHKGLKDFDGNFKAIFDSLEQQSNH